ncbi:putative aryl-alcohol dehydrogenase [Diplodia seriata]|uniref:Putative aryl-alcohol dehydrogenase n=1 Tax=Diplodia seriata TaxID=420778 RepID=A0A0G2EPM2_9PEZI|nr:putative aryl-alcohol dehydrogenase [Diplodia seriata]
MAAVDTSVSAGVESAEYDFVVIGGGTSGLTVASRLTENECIRVLVLEAGQNRLNDPKITVPGLAASTYSDPDYDWCVTSEPQVHLNGRSIGQPIGKVLGGSSAINLGMLMYPSQSDFDSWEKLGNAGWGWSSIAPYFRKFHTFTKPTGEELREGLMLDYMVEGAQGDSGPVQVSFGGADGSAPFSKAWPRAFSALNLEMTGDPITGIASGPLSACPLPSSFLPLYDQDISPVDLSELFSAHLSDADLPANLRAQYDVLKAQLSSPGNASVQYTLAPFQITPSAGASPKDFLSMPVPGFYASIVSVLNHPFSRGSVHVKSSDPRAAPAFDPQAMSHPIDLEIHARHLFFPERLRATPPLADLFKEGGQRIHNGGKAVETMDEAREMREHPV